MKSDSKNYVRLQDDEITELVHTIKSACEMLSNCDKKLLSNLMRRCDVCLKQPTDSRNYYGFVVDEFSKHKIAMVFIFPTAGRGLK